MTNASRIESGDQTTSDTPPLMSLTFCASPPAAIEQPDLRALFFSSSVPRDETNARYLPSGLQRGDDSLSVEKVNRRCSVPSHFTIHTSVLRLSASVSMVVTV